MENGKLAKFFPGDHFVDDKLMFLIKKVIDISLDDFHSTKPQQIIMGAVIHLLMELKWAQRYEDQSGHPAWVVTTKGRAATKSIYMELREDAPRVQPQTEDWAEA